MTANHKIELFSLGKVVGFQGLRGEMKIRPSTNNPALLLDISQVEIICLDGRRVQAAVQSLRLQRRLLLVHLKHYPDRTSVEQFAGAQLFADRKQLRNLDLDEWWVSDLIGLQAYTTNGQLLGTISSIIDAGNQLLEITAPDSNKTTLVPFVRNLVPLVDTQSGKVEICDLPGLIDFS